MKAAAIGCRWLCNWVCVNWAGGVGGGGAAAFPPADPRKLPDWMGCRIPELSFPHSTHRTASTHSCFRNSGCFFYLRLQTVNNKHWMDEDESML